MAISPHDAMTLSEEEKEQVDSLEGELDRILQVEFSEKSYQISIRRLSEGTLAKIPERIYRGLKSRYANAGWTVEQVESEEQVIVDWADEDKKMPVYELMSVHNLLFSVE